MELGCGANCLGYQLSPVPVGSVSMKRTDGYIVYNLRTLSWLFGILFVLFCFASLVGGFEALFNLVFGVVT